MPSVLFFAIVFALIAWASAYTMRPQKDAGRGIDIKDEDIESVTVCYRKERVWVVGVFTLMPLMFLTRVPEEYAKQGHGDAFGWTILTFTLMAVGAWWIAYARRKMVFDREGVRVVGIAARRIAWDELASVKTTYGKIVRFFPKNGGPSVNIDSTMDGWPTLVRVLPRLVKGRAKTLVDQAWAEIGGGAKAGA